MNYKQYRKIQSYRNITSNSTKKLVLFFGIGVIIVTTILFVMEVLK